MTTPPQPNHNWDSSTRRKDPPGWKFVRQLVISRALGICEHISDPDIVTGLPYRCTYPGKDVDHIINLASGGTDHLSNLQLLCDWHHKQKTAQEAAAKRKPRSERHPREKHPGML